MSSVDLRNDNVPCRYFSNFPVDYKVVKCRPVDFKSQWPPTSSRDITAGSMVKTGTDTPLIRPLYRSRESGFVCGKSSCEGRIIKKK